jgi:hypothetical protein
MIFAFAFCVLLFQMRQPGRGERAKLASEVFVVATEYCCLIVTAATRGVSGQGGFAFPLFSNTE